jgi:uncharacterized protein
VRRDAHLEAEIEAEPLLAGQQARALNEPDERVEWGRQRMMDSITVRNLSFDVDADVPRHWHGGRRSITTFFDNLSVFFPVGERFFIAAVRAHGAFVRDPRLLEEVRAFCGQEGVHGREHARYNAMLERQGYPVGAMERRVEALLGRASKRLPRRSRLAVTCALEHFTALLAHMLLGDARLLEGAHPEMAALWRWHAAEENEHKSVAYDVYLASGGAYAARIGFMVLASVIFWAKILEHQVRMMKVDGALFSAREWGSLIRFLFVEPGAMRGVMRLYFRYYRPGFHPRDIDSSALIEGWKREYGEGRERIHP